MKCLRLRTYHGYKGLKYLMSTKLGQGKGGSTVMTPLGRFSIQLGLYFIPQH